jgi:transposase
VIAIGVDTHKQSLAACAVNELGLAVAERSFGNDTKGHGALLRWAAEFRSRRFGLEGASNFGAGLTRALTEAGEDVREVPAILTRRERRRTGRAGKSDPIDALAVARVVAREPGLPPARAENRARDLKVLVDYRDQLIYERTRTGNRLHADLQILAPGYLGRIRRLVTKTQLRDARELLRSTPGVRAELALMRLGRLEALDREIVELKCRIAAMIEASGTSLTTITGLGPITAAKLLGEAGDIRRFRSKAAFARAGGTAPIPASSGQTQRHRLSRGGNRQLNRALHTVALVQARVDPRAIAYLERKRAEGKTRAEAIRCMKRHLANVVFAVMVDDVSRGVLDT